MNSIIDSISLNDLTENDFDLLQSALSHDKLVLSELPDLLLEMKIKNGIKKKYHDKIKVKDDKRRKNSEKRFYIYIERKQITATTYDGLIDKLYKMEYSQQKSKLSLTDLYPEWLIWKKDNTSISSKSLKEYTYEWKIFIENEDIKKMPIAKLKAIDFINLFRKLTKEQTLTRKRFNNFKSLLNGIYSYAIENEIVTSNPIKEIDCRQFRFKPVNNSEEVFSIKDREILLNYLDGINDIYSLAIQFDFHAILRIGELLSLRYVDIEDGNLHVQSQRLVDYTMNDDLSFSPKEYTNVNHIKGRMSDGFRYQPLTPKAKLILEKVKKLNPDGDYIFMTEGRQLTTDTFNARLRKYCNEVGIKSRSSHKIRFTVASMLYTNGMPLTSLQRLLGHTTIAMTMQYLRQVKPIEETSDIMCSILD